MSIVRLELGVVMQSIIATTEQKCFHGVPLTFIALAMLLLVAVPCVSEKITNPLANVESKQPDKALFDRAMEQIKHDRFDQARMILQTLINTYPDSEYIPRAKLAVGDSWYAAGGTTSRAQAELEYKDFITFFPNMPEAAEAQLKIANIHFQLMEKPDRDCTHTVRAEEEYRQLIRQFPDSGLLPEAKQRLLEVQEVLARREFQIGRFYYLRNSYPAAIARLRSVIEQYPLFSGGDEVLHLLGHSYEGQITNVRASKMPEAVKAAMIQEFTKNAAAAYSEILTLYPMMDHAADAKHRLLALHEAVPIPTQAAIMQNQKEKESRRSSGLFKHLTGIFGRHPEFSQATKVGEPTLLDPKPARATKVLAAANHASFGSAAKSADNEVFAEAVQKGTHPSAELVRSDVPASTTAPESSDTPVNTTPAAVETVPARTGSNTTVAATLNSPKRIDIRDLTPNVDPDAQTPPPPPQVNDIQKDSLQEEDSSNIANSLFGSSTNQNIVKRNSQSVSSSKAKKKTQNHIF